MSEHQGSIHSFKSIFGIWKSKEPIFLIQTAERAWDFYTSGWVGRNSKV